MILRSALLAVTTMTALLVSVLPAIGSPADSIPSPSPSPSSEPDATAGAAYPKEASASPSPSPGSDAIVYGEGAITVTSDGWIHYKSDLEVLGSQVRRVTVSADKGSDGSCTSSGSESGDGASVATDTITVREQVAFNPATCESEYLIADVTPADGATYDRFAPSQEAQEPATALARTNYTRWFRTIWEDPIQIDITKETVAQRWNSNSVLKRQHKTYGFNGCLPGGYCPDRTHVDSSAAYVGNYSNRFEYSGVSHLHNSSFANWVVAVIGATGWAACGFPTNFRANFSHDVQVVGFKSGSWDRAWHDKRNGACTNLVHHDEATGSSWPF